MAEITDFLNIGVNEDRVAFVQFGNTGTKEFGLTSYTSVSKLKEAILKVDIKDENTNTSGGIKVMRTEAFSTQEDRKGVDNVAIVITDGKSTRDSKQTIPEARKAEADNIKVYTIGITPSIDKYEIRKISSAPMWENVTYWILPDFNVFNSFRIIEQVFSTFCIAASSITTTPSSGKHKCEF